MELGRKVRKRYDALFADLDPKQINDVVRSYTSNKQRTLFSAWSFLNGMFPSTPRHFMYLGDRQHLDMAAVEAELEKTHTGMGIAIMVSTVGHGVPSECKSVYSKLLGLRLYKITPSMREQGVQAFYSLTVSTLRSSLQRTPTSCFIKSNHQIAMKRRKSSRRKRCSNILG